MASKEALILAKPKPTVDSILPEIRLMIYYYILAEPIKLSVATDPSAEEYRPMIRRLSGRLSATEYLLAKPHHNLAIGHNARIPIWNSCRPDVVSILEDAMMNWTSVGIYMERDTLGRKRTVILVTVHDASMHRIWRETTVALDRMLYVRDTRDLAIEFRAPDEPEKYCFAMRDEHPVVTCWRDGLRDPIIRILEEKTRWETMSVFRYGTSMSEATPTVVITV
ncbi:MAG: hypothetical protein L6R39_003683 [Caloplaca ligustica]|nr:MAG: hypothetical protein L6R39_003683 [Caloplaca ligustica]